MPRELRLNADNQQAAAAIAAVLLEEGILREEHWTGNLGASLHAGLVRWIHEDLGAGNLSVLNPELSYLDDVYAENEYGHCLGATTYAWRKEFDTERYGSGNGPEITVGCFVLGFGGMAWEEEWSDWGHSVVVQERVRQLETLQAGAGWGVYALVRDALIGTVGCATPQWGLEVLRHYGIHDTDYGTDAPLPEDVPDDIEDLEFDDNPEAPITVEQFARCFPEEMFNAKWDPKPVKAIIRRRSRRQTPDRSSPPRSWGESLELAEILDLAVELAAMAKDRPAVPNHWDYLFSGKEWCLPVFLRWSERDPLPRVHDDYAEAAYESALDVTEFTWIHGFQVDRPDTIRQAVRALEYTIRVLVKVDRLLQLLHSPDSLASRLAIQVPAEPVRVEVHI